MMDRKFYCLGCMDIGRGGKGKSELIYRDVSSRKMVLTYKNRLEKNKPLCMKQNMRHD
jgi:hypothetical protein